MLGRGLGGAQVCTWACARLAALGRGLGPDRKNSCLEHFGNLGFSIVHGLALAGGRCTQISDSEFWLSYDEEGPIQKT